MLIENDERVIKWREDSADSDNGSAGVHVAVTIVEDVLSKDELTLKDERCTLISKKCEMAWFMRCNRRRKKGGRFASLTDDFSETEFYSQKEREGEIFLLLLSAPERAYEFALVTQLPRSEEPQNHFGRVFLGRVFRVLCSLCSQSQIH